MVGHSAPLTLLANVLRVWGIVRDGEKLWQRGGRGSALLRGKLAAGECDGRSVRGDIAAVGQGHLQDGGQRERGSGEHEPFDGGRSKSHGAPQTLQSVR